MVRSGIVVGASTFWGVKSLVAAEHDDIKKIKAIKKKFLDFMIWTLPEGKQVDPQSPTNRPCWKFSFWGIQSIFRRPRESQLGIVELCQTEALIVAATAPIIKLYRK